MQEHPTQSNYKLTPGQPAIFPGTHLSMPSVSKGATCTIFLRFYVRLSSVLIVLPSLYKVLSLSPLILLLDLLALNPRCEFVQHSCWQSLKVYIHIYTFWTIASCLIYCNIVWLKHQWQNCVHGLLQSAIVISVVFVAKMLWFWPCGQSTYRDAVPGLV